MVYFSFHLRVRVDFSIDLIVHSSLLSLILWQGIPLYGKWNTIKDPGEFIEIVPESENKTVTTNLNENFEHTLFGPFFNFLPLFVIGLVIKLTLGSDRNLMDAVKVLEALRTAFDSTVAKQLNRAYRSAGLYFLALFSLIVGLLSVNGWTKCTIFAVVWIVLFSCQVLSVMINLEGVMIRIYDNLHALRSHSQQILPGIQPEPDIFHIHDDYEQDVIYIYDAFDEEVIFLETSVPRIQYGADVVNELEINYDQAFYFRIFVTDFFN
ncbi:unnamed protein product [Orchesella dallaii]|uniref:Uncharacterized protein n=1 Tax=Orchesella dallaii TaxID=48710 RepID=A0ABP1RQZ7_9HEXA